MNPNAQLSEYAKIVAGLAPVVPASAVPDYVSLKNYGKLTVIISVANATTVTGAAVTLKQATDVSAGSEKALPFSVVKANVDVAASDALAVTAVTNNTFTTATTNSKNLLYVLEVSTDDLDYNNGFDCVRAGVGNATAATVSVLYILSNPRHISGGLASAIVN
jgi:hypothetical protein